ncbi:MAG: T9SS type A sorting domain-containing protein [Cyclobacteriaceae bacterium]
MIKISKFFLGLFGFGLALMVDAQSQTPAFSTAEGYGKWASGGRGGKVVEVTSLEDKDRRGNIVEGGFRWALTQYPGEPITIVFKVSGVIDLAGGELRSKRDNVTIAGQTAPGDGVCIKGGNVNFGGSNNMIIRHMRFRVGLMDDGAFIEGGALGYENGSNFIIDHCTFGWAGEENMTIYDNTLSTVQWCYIHEGLYNVGHPKGNRGYGVQWGGQTSTYHHNLLAHNYSRTPRVNGARSNDINVLMDYVNNVNYNWGKANSSYGGDLVEGQSHHCNWVNNYYKPGPARAGTSWSYFVQASFNPNQTISQIPKWYLDGNHIEGTANADRNTDNYVGLDAGAYTEKGIDKSELISSAAFEVPYDLNVESAEDAFTSVVEKAGAWPRDTCDTRIAREVRTGTASGTGTIGNGMIDDPEVVGGFQVYKTYNIAADWDHDGMADYWEAANELDSTNAEDRNTLSADGYTALEVYINYLAGEEHPDYIFPNPQYIDAEPEEPELSKKNIKTGLSVFVDEFGQLMIKSIEPIVNVVIYDLNGRVAQRSKSNELDISNLRKGLYIARVEMQNGDTHPVKFMK